MAERDSAINEKGSIPVVVADELRAILYTSYPSSFIWRAEQSCKNKRIFFSSPLESLRFPWEAGFIDKGADQVFKYVILEDRENAKSEIADITNFAGENGLNGRVKISKTGDIHAGYRLNHELWIKDAQTLLKDNNTPIRYTMTKFGAVFQAQRGRQYFTVGLNNPLGEGFNNIFRQLSKYKMNQIDVPIMKDVEWYNDLVHAKRA